MSNIIDALMNMFASLHDDEPKPPLHVGEVMSCWTYYETLGNMLSYEEAALNITTHEELHKVLLEAVEVCKSQFERLRTLLVEEGIPIPDAYTPKPKSDPKLVPEGVKLTDIEIANGVAVKVVACTMSCASFAAESLRTDVGLMFTRFQLEQMVFGANLKPIMRKNGWVKNPPPFNPQK